MKNLNIIQWLVSLGAGKLILALLLITVSVLYIDNKTTRSEKDDRIDQLRIEAGKAYEYQLRQKEICDSAITLIRMEYNKKYEDFLREQIQKLEATKRENKEVISRNNQILRNKIQ